MALSVSWRWGEILVAAGFVLFSALCWWGAGFLRNEGSLGVFFVGLMGSSVALATMHIVEGTQSEVRRLAVVFGFGVALPFTFPQKDVLGLSLLFFAIPFLEFAALRANRLRHNLRYVRVLPLARIVLPAYFTVVSAVLAAVVVVSPFGARVLANPLPEDLVRRMLSFVQPLPVAVPYEAYLKDPLVRQQFSTFAGVVLEEGDDSAAIVSKLVAQQTVRLQTSYSDVFRIGFFLTAFGVFRLLALPLMWAAMILLLLFLRALRGFHSIIQAEEPTVRTVMRWG